MLHIIKGMISKQLTLLIDTLKKLINKYDINITLINNEFNDENSFDLILNICHDLNKTKFNYIAEDIILLIDEFLLKEITLYRIIFFFDELYYSKINNIIDKICTQL